MRTLLRGIAPLFILAIALPANAVVLNVPGDYASVELAVNAATPGYGVALFRNLNLPDTDGDGVLDLADNCPNTHNPSQADFDGVSRVTGYGTSSWAAADHRA